MPVDRGIRKPFLKPFGGIVLHPVRGNIDYSEALKRALEVFNVLLRFLQALSLIHFVVVQEFLGNVFKTNLIEMDTLDFTLRYLPFPFLEKGLCNTFFVTLA